MKVSRGDIFLANLDPTVGRETKKTQPVIVVSNNIANEFGGAVTVIPVTSQNTERIYPFEVLLPDGSLGKASKAKADQVRTLDKLRLTKKLGTLDSETVLKVNRALKIQLEL